MGGVIDASRRRRGLAGGTAAVAIVIAAAVMFVDEAPQIFADSFEGADAGAPVPPVDPCADPLVAPPGWELRVKTWVAAFSGPTGAPRAEYPNSVGQPVPVPGYREYRSATNFLWYAKGDIVAIPFTPKANQTVDLTWDRVQAQFGYGAPRPALSMFVGYSRCKHDLRLVPGCSMVAGDGSLFQTTRRPAGPACAMEAGEQWFLNVAMVDPTIGAPLPANHTCEDVPNSAFGCDVQVRSSGY